jgi:hypothetical protein
MWTLLVRIFNKACNPSCIRFIGDSVSLQFPCQTRWNNLGSYSDETGGVICIYYTPVENARFLKHPAFVFAAADEFKQHWCFKLFE